MVVFKGSCSLPSPSEAHPFICDLSNKNPTKRFQDQLYFITGKILNFCESQVKSTDKQAMQISELLKIHALGLPALYFKCSGFFLPTTASREFL